MMSKFVITLNCSLCVYSVHSRCVLCLGSIQIQYCMYTLMVEYIPAAASLEVCGICDDVSSVDHLPPCFL